MRILFITLLLLIAFTSGLYIESSYRLFGYHNVDGPRLSEEHDKLIASQLALHPSSGGLYSQDNESPLEFHSDSRTTSSLLPDETINNDLSKQTFNRNYSRSEEERIEQIRDTTSPQQVEQLAHFLGDSSAQVRLEAIKALGIVDTEESLRVLAQVLFSEPNGKNKIAAIKIFELRQDLSFVRDLLAYVSSHESNLSVVEAAQSAVQ